MVRSLLFNINRLKDCMHWSKKHFWSRILTYKCFLGRKLVIIVCWNQSIMTVVIYHSVQISGYTFFCLSLHPTTLNMRSPAGWKKTDHLNAKRHLMFLVSKWRSSRLWDKKLILRLPKAIDFWLATVISFVALCFKLKLCNLSLRMSRKRFMRVIEYIYLHRLVRWH